MHKSDVSQVLQQAARAIAKAGAGKPTSKAELKAWLARQRLPPAQRAVVDLFIKFSDFNPDGSVTARELGRAVEHARQQLVEKYGLGDSPLSRAELEQLHVVGKRAHDLARALRATAVETD